MNKEFFNILDNEARTFLSEASCVSEDVLTQWVEDSKYAYLLRKVLEGRIEELTLKLALDGIDKKECVEESKQLTLPGISLT